MTCHLAWQDNPLRVTKLQEGKEEITSNLSYTTGSVAAVYR